MNYVMSFFLCFALIDQLCSRANLNGLPEGGKAQVEKSEI